MLILIFFLVCPRKDLDLGAATRNEKEKLEIVNEGTSDSLHSKTDNCAVSIPFVVFIA